jgi:hypothetical protein
MPKNNSQKLSPMAQAIRKRANYSMSVLANALAMKMCQSRGIHRKAVKKELSFTEKALKARTSRMLAKTGAHDQMVMERAVRIACTRARRIAMN